VNRVNHPSKVELEFLSKIHFSQISIELKFVMKIKNKDKDEVEYDESGSLLHDVKKLSVWRKIFYAVGGM
jgi:hypothetical protein